MSNYTEEIIKNLKCLSGEYSVEAVFSDWVACAAISTQNALCVIHNKLWEERENRYKEIMKKYHDKGEDVFAECCALLALLLEEKMYDALGEIYMRLEMGSKHAGQFFTPFHLSKLTASLVGIQPDELGIYRLDEPSVGSGGMVIAYAKNLRDNGINYQQKLKVVAQDIDWRGVHMSYLQFSLLGIHAVVVQGDTLRQPYKTGYPKERVLYTPQYMLMFRG